MGFPLFDLPGAAVELILGSLDEREDRRTLRLVCKRSCDSVDRSVVAVKAYATALSPAQLATLAGAPWSLLRLEVSSAQLDAPATAVLATANWAGLLQSLYLSRNKLCGQAEVAALAAAGTSHWPALRQLNLSFNSMDAGGAAALAAALRFLCLDDNCLSDEGAAAALAAGHWPVLEELALARNGLGGAAAAALATARLPALQELCLMRNNLGAEGAAALAAADWPALQTLDLVANGLGPHGAAALAESRAMWPALEELYVCRNDMGASGAAALAAAALDETRFPHLHLLYMRSNGMVYDDLAALQAGKQPKKLSIRI